MTKATITRHAENFVAAIRADEELQHADERRITYEVTALPGAGRAAGGSQIIALAFTDTEPIFPLTLIVTLPRVRKAGEWLGFLHDEVNRLLAAKPAVKLTASTTTPSKR